MNDDNDRPSALRYRGRWQRRGVGLLWVAAVVVACALVLAAAVSCGEDAPLSTVTVDAPAPGADTQQPPVQTEASAAASSTVPTTSGDAGGGSDNSGGVSAEAEAEAVAEAVADAEGDAGGEVAAAGRLRRVREAGRAASEAAERVERVREAGAADEQPAEAGPLAHIDPTTTTTTTARPRPAPTTTRPGDLPAPATTAPDTAHVHPENEDGTTQRGHSKVSWDPADGCDQYDKYTDCGAVRYVNWQFDYGNLNTLARADGRLEDVVTFEEYVSWFLNSPH